MLVAETYADSFSRYGGEWFARATTAILILSIKIQQQIKSFVLEVIEKFKASKMDVVLMRRWTKQKMMQTDMN
jgi:hypothetical protein